MSTCVTFGEDCIAFFFLIIGYWNQVSLGVFKSINGLSSGGRDIFGNAWIRPSWPK